MNLVEEVKKKKEFSGLPNSIVGKALKISDGDVKGARSLLRKYFGVFLTNRILKGGGDLLGIHISSKKRDYEKFYKEIFSGVEGIGSVIDLGCGVNGFSYNYFRNILGDVDYVGVDAVGQLVDIMNDYFEREGSPGVVFSGDLFDIEGVLSVLKRQKKNRVVFLLQVIDALEWFEKGFSKRFLLEISRECEEVVLSLSIESLGKRKKFASRREWLVDFLDENFVIEKDFVMTGERIICFHK